MKRPRLNRRETLSGFGQLGRRVVPRIGQTTIKENLSLPPRAELVNALEFEDIARMALSPSAFEQIDGSHREPFDRITFRQRLMVKADLDLTMELFGEQLFAPIMVGPVAAQQTFHPDGELATARGASAAKATMVVSSRSSYPFEQISNHAVTSALWYQIYAEDGLAPLEIRRAVDAGAKAVCITVTDTGIDWESIDQLRKLIDIPLLVKGILNAKDAENVIQRGLNGIVVSNHGASVEQPRRSPIEVLPVIADAVHERVPILIDGSFRRGTDVLKALALGARAVLVARPLMWGLAAYGASGVQTVLEILYNQLALSMAAAGRPRIPMIDRTLVRIDTR